MKIIDTRKQKLRKGLEQLSKAQILRLLLCDKEDLVTDEYFYHKGRY
jgi:hypothetical protein